MFKNALLVSLSIFSLQLFCITTTAFADAASELEQADAYYKNKDYSQAEAIYQNVKTYYPGTEEAYKAYRKLVVLYIVTGNQSQEQATFQELVTTYPDNIHTARAIHDIGSACRNNLKKYYKAKQYYQYAKDNFSGSNYLIWSGKKYILCALWAQKDIIKTELCLGNDTAAEAGIQTMRSDFSDHNDLLAALRSVADCYLKLKQYSKAAALFQNILDTDPNDADAIHCQKGLVYSNIWLHNAPNATETKAAIDKLVADFNDHSNYAYAILRVGQEYYNKALNLEVQDYTSQAESNFSKAIEVWQPILTKEPFNLATVRAYYMTAQSYRKLGNCEEATEHYEHILDTWEEDESMATYLIGSRKNLAILNIDMGYDPNALAQVEQLTADFNDNPQLPKAVFDIGEKFYYKALNNGHQDPNTGVGNYFSKALTVLGKITQGMSASAERIATTHFYSAVCCYKAGDYAKAAQHYEKVVQNCPDYEFAWNAQFMVGGCYKKLTKAGDISNAVGQTKTRTAYEQLLIKYPNCKVASIVSSWLSKYSNTQ